MADEQIELIARGLLVRGSRVLLCRSLKRGYMYLPGGHVEFGETAAEALAREWMEELGWPVRVGELALAAEVLFRDAKRDRHELNLVFHVEQGGQGVTGETASREPKIAFDWVDLAAVVDLDVRPTAIRAWLASGAGLMAGTSDRWVSQREG